MRAMPFTLVLIFAVLACSDSRPDLADFAAEYVRSVYDGSSLYKRYTPEEGREVVEISRSNMTADFVITGWDYAGAGNYEYGIKFSNGATGVVAVYEQEGEIKAAGIIVELAQKE